MNKTIVVITTAQTIPLYLLIKTLYEQNDNVVLITTAKMTAQGQYISEELDMDVKTIALEESLEENWDAMHKVFEKAFPDGGNYVVDLTGGTKLIAVSVYDFFSKERKAEFTYVPLSKNGFLSLPASDITDFTCKIGVRDFLAVSLGLEIKCDSPYSDQKDAEVMYGIFASSASMQKLADRIRRVDKNSRRKGLRSLTAYRLKAPVNRVRGQLSSENGKPKNAVSAGFVQYITGGWFEEYIYYLVERTIKPDDIQIGAHIRSNGATNSNELDVSFTIDNALYVIECKTLVDSSLFTDTTYKSDSVVTKFGLKARSIICTLSPLNEEQKQRAKRRGVKAIGGNDIKNPAIFKTLVLGQ